jgi:hypothetical protein
MNRLTLSLLILATFFLASFLASAREIRLPAEGALAGNVVIAEWFYKTEHVKGKDVTTPRTFQLWPQKNGAKASDWLDGRIEAQPGDVIVLSPGSYSAQLWVFTPGVTITTDPSSQDRAAIQGTLEVDADRVTIDRIAVVGPHTVGTSPGGHGIELNRTFLDWVTIRNCRIAGNPWTGIHIVGDEGEMVEIRVEFCEIAGNGTDGMDCRFAARLVLTGCTITGNGTSNDAGVGLRLERGIGQVTLEKTTISGNRNGDVCTSDPAKWPWASRCP